MTTYVLGAGASFHAGFPLCSQLWAKMSKWADETQDPDSEHRETINAVAAKAGTIFDVEQMLTEFGSEDGTFRDLSDGKRRRLMSGIRKCVLAYFLDIHANNASASLYQSLSRHVEDGDALMTFNYDVALESELIRAQRFRIRDGYGFEQDWDEPHSPVRVLKPHGSINWRGCHSFDAPMSDKALGQHPFVENFSGLFDGYPNRVLDKSFARRFPQVAPLDP